MWTDTFCSIIPLAIAFKKSSTRVLRGKAIGFDEHNDIQTPCFGLQGFYQLPVRNGSCKRQQLLWAKQLLNCIRIYNFLLVEKIHFYQVPWEYAHWEETKLFPSWEQLISLQYLQTWGLICAAGHQPLQALSHPGCIGTPLCTFEEKQHLRITALRAENNEGLHK